VQRQRRAREQYDVEREQGKKGTHTFSDCGRADRAGPAIVRHTMRPVLTSQREETRTRAWTLQGKLLW
jgi:hypothetical protein